MSTPDFADLLKNLDQIGPVFGPAGKAVKLSRDQSESLQKISQVCQETGDTLEFGLRVVGKLMAVSAASDFPMDTRETEALGWFISELGDVIHRLKEMGQDAEYRVQVHGKAMEAMQGVRRHG